MTHVEPIDPHEAFAELGHIRLADIDIDTLLDKIAQLAKRTVPGASEVSVTLLHGNIPQTAAFTGELARALDERQYERGYGPCLDAADTTTSLLVPDTSSEQRWPGWAQEAAQAGAHSSLSVGLPVHEPVTGALNIYATTPKAFDDDAITIAQTFAGFAAVGLANAHLYATQAVLAGHMQKAMENRAVIEQAKGIIMGDRRCTPDQAFAILTKLSQDSNRKLRDVATALVENAYRRSRPGAEG
jgi:GAF domain-containing protein